MRRSTLLLLPLALTLISCESSPTAAKKKEPEKPPEPITAMQAFQNMFGAARAWSPDVQILQLASVPIAEVKAGKGKYGAWQAIFVSPGKGRSKTYTYSVVEAGGNLHKGVFGLPDEAYSPRGQTKPFVVQALKHDSDEAYEVAAKKSAEQLKKFPDMPVMFQLEMTPRFPNLAWRVIWGESVSSSSYSIFVDASTGEYLATAH
ncbi:MAG: hypothetical protein HY820_24110 [Acidobacteria bacterium]|nr:hypothetical protein [Acidobacteriota bacterium]